MSTSRQTLSFLRRRFKQAGIRPRARMGQNFLIDLNLLGVLLEAAAVEPNDLVLEVGCGTGALTALVAPRAAAAVAVEVDPNLCRLAAEQLRRFDNVTLLQIDALKNKNRLNPAMLEAVKAELEKTERRFKLVANLPYNVAGPLLGNLLALDRPPRTMTVTVQKELAERIAARPGNKSFGALTAWIQSQCRARILRTLPPDVFWPRPKVSSAFVQIELDDRLRGRIPDRGYFRAFLRGIFRHRRKFLRSQLKTAAADRLNKAEADALLTRMGLDGKQRAEQLDVNTLLALCEAARTYAYS